MAGDPDEDFILRARWMDRNADFLFVFGGTNDFGHGDAPLGQMGDKTPFTFYGAMDTLCSDLLRYGFKNDRICFIMPTRRFDEDSLVGDGSKRRDTSLTQYWMTTLRRRKRYALITRLIH